MCYPNRSDFLNNMFDVLAHFPPSPCICKCSSTIIHWMSHSMLFSLLVISTFKRLRLLRYVTTGEGFFCLMVGDNEFQYIKIYTHIDFNSSLRSTMGKERNKYIKSANNCWAVFDHKEVDFYLIIWKIFWKYLF